VYGDKLIKWMASVGMRHMLSENDWRKCLEIAQEKGGWAKYIGHNWNYNNHYTSDMHMIVKKRLLDDEGIQNESFGQNITMQKIWVDVMFFMHGGRNRSLNELTLRHEKSIYKESEIHQGTQEGKKPGIVNRALNNIKKLGG
jgi:hypothetical protein